MDKILLFFCTVVFIATDVSANPIDPRRGPLISEVFIQSPTKWYIELNTVYGALKETPPCSTSVFWLQIASMKKTYHVRVFEDESHMALITRASLCDIPLSEQVLLAQIDTITVIDSTDGFYGLWRFPVRPVAQGHSLINTATLSAVGALPNPVETDRVTIGVLGDPSYIYRSNFISEVQFIDSAHWAIELDHDNSGRYNDKVFPCTLSQFKLQVGSSNIYPIKVIFDTNKIAVLRPDNLGSSPVIFNNLSFPATIKIYDFKWDPILAKSLYWEFTIKQPGDSAHSLVNGGAAQTGRVNIGKRTSGYTTEYVLRFFDQRRNPINDWHEYETSPTECLAKPFYPFPDDSISCSIELGVSNYWLGFSRTQIPNDSCVTKSTFNGVVWEGSYIDSVVRRTDTIVLPDPTTRQFNIPARTNEKQRFFSVNRGDNQILFSATFPDKVMCAQVRIVSLDGKLVAKFPVGPVVAAGTYSCEWSYQKSKSSGTFLSTLLIDGVPTQSLKIKVW